jgi:PKD repeat protein
MAIRLFARRFLRIALLSAATGSAAACSLGNQEAPELIGPSQFGRTITLTATPDQLVQDGTSQTTVTAVVRNEAGAPVQGVLLNFGVTSSDGRFITPSAQAVVTDANGRAQVTVTAPAAPSALPDSPVTLTVTASPVGDNLDNVTPQQISVRLVPPPGTLPANNPPVAAFTASPTVASVNQNITFDASSTTDERVVCGTNCTYAWDFGDGTLGSGITVTKQFSTSAGTSVTVTLTVTDPRGATDTETRTITVTAPTAPDASITVSPTQPRVNQAVNFDASGSTVGSGASITQYEWVWGDGTANTTSASAQTQHTYSAAGTYVVRLTVRDSLGRTDSTTTNVTIAQ